MTGAGDDAYAQRIARFAATPKHAAECRALLDRLDLAAGAQVLDLGSGSGAALARWRAAGLRALGTDRRAWPAPPAVERPAVLADASGLPFAAGSFDAVILMHVIAHLADPAATLGEVRRVLRPAGRLGVVTPNRRFDQALARLPRLGPRHVPDRTVRRHFTAEELETLVVAAGLLPARLEPFGKRPWSLPLASHRERLLLIAERG